MRGVVFVDQRLGVGPDHARDAADVATGIEVAAAGGEVIMLDAPDDRLPDAGPLADLRNGETGPALPIVRARFWPFTVSRIPPGLPICMVTACRNVQVLVLPPTT